MIVTAYQDLYINQGTDFTTALTLTDNFGNPINLSGSNLLSQAKKSFTGNAAITFATTVADPTNGLVYLSIDAANTISVPSGTFVYDVLVQDPQNNITRVLEGRLFLSAAVTNPALFPVIN